MNYHKVISFGSVVALTGYITSGPIGFLIARTVKPQPVWTSPKVFVENHHIIQDIPFYFGFLLIGGMLMVVAGHYLNFTKDDPANEFSLLVALGWTIAFFTLISFNYICQTTFVRNLALHYRPEDDFAIATFSMVNPQSFCWAIEIWGYGFLGVATWLMAGYYSERNNAIRMLLITNGVVSIATVAFIIVDTSWLLTTAGLIAYFVWNLLMIVLMILIYIHSRKLDS